MLTIPRLARFAAPELIHSAYAPPTQDAPAPSSSLAKSPPPAPAPPGLKASARFSEKPPTLAGSSDAMANQLLKTSDLQRRTRDWSSALASLQRAHELAPQSEEIVLALGTLLAKLDQPLAAFQVYGDFLEKHPEAGAVWLNSLLLGRDYLNYVRKSQTFDADDLTRSLGKNLEEVLRKRIDSDLSGLSKALPQWMAQIENSEKAFEKNLQNFPEERLAQGTDLFQRLLQLWTLENTGLPTHVEGNIRSFAAKKFENLHRLAAPDPVEDVRELGELSKSLAYEGDIDTEVLQKMLDRKCRAWGEGDLARGRAIFQERIEDAAILGWDFEEIGISLSLRRAYDILEAVRNKKLQLANSAIVEAWAQQLLLAVSLAKKLEVRNERNAAIDRVLITQGLVAQVIDKLDGGAGVSIAEALKALHEKGPAQYRIEAGRILSGKTPAFDDAGDIFDLIDYASGTIPRAELGEKLLARAQILALDPAQPQELALAICETVAYLSSDEAQRKKARELGEELSKRVPL